MHRRFHDPVSLGGRRLSPVPSGSVRRIGVVVVAAALMAACGDPGPAQPTFDNTDTGAPVGQTPLPEVTPAAPQTAAPVASDTNVTVHPITYPDPADGCYGLASSVALGSAPYRCQTEWVNTGMPLIPGNDIMTNAPMPRTIHVAAAIAPSVAADDAAAFYQGTVLQNWSYEHQATKLLAVLESAFYTSNDRVLQEMLKKNAAVLDIPDCYYPSSVRITPITPDVQAYLVSIGWPQPSGVAAVADYAACPGITFAYQGGARKTMFGNSKPGAAVITGSAQTIAPFGKVWVIDGYGLCGEPKLAPVCGG